MELLHHYRFLGNLQPLYLHRFDLANQRYLLLLQDLIPLFHFSFLTSFLILLLFYLVHEIRSSLIGLVYRIITFKYIILKSKLKDKVLSLVLDFNNMFCLHPTVTLIKLKFY